MILDKEINLIINNYIKKYYVNLGYNIPNYRDPVVSVKVSDLHKNSNEILNCACDICGLEKKIKYQSYNKYLEKYGIYTCIKCNDEKKKKTKLERYGYENYNNKEKNKKTCLERYGVEYVLQVKEIKEKVKQTNLERYGTEYSFQSEIIKEKTRKTNNDRYGVDNPTQNQDILLKSFKSGHKIHYYKDTNLYYQGSYELDFLKKYYNIGIENGPTIKYTFENQEHIYFSDFYYKPLNLIIEVKSNYTYNIHKNKNISKGNKCREIGYKYIVIIDKNYSDFEKLIDEK